MKTVCTTAVIVHWGDLGPTIEVALRYERAKIFSKIVVVANDLRDCPAELHDTEVLWVNPPRNLGFGGGCNFGAREHPAEKYAFLNPDVTIEPEAITMCFKALDAPGVGISAPTLYFSNGKLQSACGSLSRFMKIAQVTTPPQKGLTECVWVTGAALFCKQEVLESVGFDGSYFLGFEDLDIGYRANLAGWKVVVVSRAVGVHPGRTTLNGARPVYYGARNQIWFTRRHGSLWGTVAATGYLLLTAPRVILADVMKRRSPHALLMYRGLVAGWRLLPNIGDPMADEPIPSRWINWQSNR